MDNNIVNDVDIYRDITRTCSFLSSVRWYEIKFYCFVAKTNNIPGSIPEIFLPQTHRPRMLTYMTVIYTIKYAQIHK